MSLDMTVRRRRIPLPGVKKTYKLFQRKDFPKVTIGKKLLVKESELDRYIEKYGGAIIEI